jgi:Spy/CpxP family protein refolding chaperone
VPTTAKPNKAIERLQAQLVPLNLTDDQKAKVDAIIQDEEKSAADLKKDKGTAKADRQAERQELRQDTLDKIRAVLTPEQAAKFAKHGKGKGKVKADKGTRPRTNR